ncbi:MAG: BlaI/MecI/CopY family transcriptional regulator [Lachnospiraceae bacterium]|nr:BlaI/MecI/CopY family transcriptional regulator [Lachnospiraceae bacterium]
MNSNHDLLLGEVEGRFADIIWENAPVSSTQLVKLAEQELHWKRTTTHTVIRRLCEKGLFHKDESGIVTILISKEELRARQSNQFVDMVCGGSLPLFVSGFVRNRKLSDADIEEIISVLKEKQ